MQLNRLSVLVAPGLLLLLFAPALLGESRLAFRDVSHFYTPLYDYVASRCDQQWLPLWNPLDQTGIPLVGETTTAVFYPVRYLLFALPISGEVAISWYVVLHLILASITSSVAARWTGVGNTAASLTGIIYSLSGSVLFLYSNPPFLVAAAWLPLAIGSLVARGPLADRTRICVAGTSMSMMILGGDPQTALHVMIIAGLVWAFAMATRKPAVVDLRIILAAPMLAAALAAPQLAASISWSRQSERILSKSQEDWIAPPIVGGRRFEAYQYSVAPWHALELASPRLFGSLLPQNTRISSLFPGDGRTWTPSIYMGMLTFLAVVLRVGRLRRQRADVVWLSIALASLWLAMGHFGVVWLIQTTTQILPDVDSAIGGPYWWLYQFVPGYDSFRYPAKWLPMFSFAISIVVTQVVNDQLLINEGRDLQLDNESPQRWLRWYFASFALIAACWAATTTLRWNPDWLLGSIERLPSDEFWGPLNVPLAVSEIWISLVHSMLALLSIGAVFWLRGKNRLSLQNAALTLLLIVAIDSGFAARSMIATVSLDQERALIQNLDRPEHPPKTRWMRTQTRDGWPEVWKRSTDPNRLPDVESSVRAAWFGRWHLEDRVSVLNNMVSIRSNASATFWKATTRITVGMSGAEREQFWASIRRWLSINGVIHTTGESLDVPIHGRIAKMVDRRDFQLSSDASTRHHSNWNVDDSLEMRFVARLKAIAEAGGLSPPTIQGERTIPNAMEPAMARTEVSPQSSAIERIAGNAEKAEFVIRLDEEGLLTRPVYQDGHWKARYMPVDRSPDADSSAPQNIGQATRWRSIPVHRVDLLTQGVLLPAGQWRLQFHYSPWWQGWSLCLAAIAWTLLAIMWVRPRTSRGAKLSDVPIPTADASSQGHPEH